MQGCSGQQDRDTAPLLQMAKLLVAMESQRGAASKIHSHQQQADQDAPQQADPATSINRITQLLYAAVGQLSKLLSEAVQLFPSDMEGALKPYGCVRASCSSNVPATCQTACSGSIIYRW